MNRRRMSTALAAVRAALTRQPVVAWSADELPPALHQPTRTYDAVQPAPDAEAMSARLVNARPATATPAPSRQVRPVQVPWPAHAGPAPAAGRHRLGGRSDDTMLRLIPARLMHDVLAGRDQTVR